MPLILVTGTSTSGKSAVAKELVKRGYEAYDMEHNGISAWYNKKTGKRAAEFGAMPERTEVWLRQHEWRTSIDWVKQKAAEAKDKPIFLCGGAANEADIRALCQTVLWLKTDEETIQKRVNNARDHDYGTKPHELAQIIKVNSYNETIYPSKFGALMVDARQPIDVVVDETLKAVGIDQVLLCQSKNGVAVFYDPVYSHTATHLEDTPRLKSLVTEAIGNMNLEEDNVATHVDMGRIVGTCDVVDVDNSDEIVYGVRKNRETDGSVPFTKSREGDHCPYVAVHLIGRSNGSYLLLSTWIGTFGDDDEPFPNASNATERSMDFWNKHAFVYGSQEIVKETETTDRPW
ncbi:MAG: AAA family ATPase [Candidatus Saccharimonadales bacterium]